MLNLYKINTYIILLTILLSIPFSSFAETHIKNSDIKESNFWNKNNSPYILDESIYIYDWQKLIIGPGVTIMSASTTENNSEINNITVDGDMDINGSAEYPVIIDKLDTLNFISSNMNIQNAVFQNTGINLTKSTTSISNTLMKDSETAILTRGSLVNIKNSIIRNNKIGILSNKYSIGVFVSSANMIIDGLSNSLEPLGSNNDLQQNIIKIVDSSIIDNEEYGILNRINNIIDARANWWGNKNGPRTDIVGDGDRISGYIEISPWRDDPKLIKKCCSNVLFIPGIEASRLYKDENTLLGTSTNTLWEPNRNADIEKLYLDESGNSINKDIYTNDILDSAYGVKDIYKSFIIMMNDMVADKIIKKWLPFPYDWRLGIDNIVYGNTRLSTSSISLIKTVEDLAKNSFNGKVTIIAHSNGGLISKLLLKALEEKNELNIIDKVILVAVPELGTPQSILAMLHGYNQSILGGLAMNKNNSRTFSKNSSGAYGLLPSKEYFNKGAIAVISDLFSNTNNSLIDNYNSMKSFLISNIFSKAVTDNINNPILLNPALIDKADNLHSRIDNLKNSSTTNLISIIGWGIPTANQLKYEKDPHCQSNKRNKCSMIFYPELTDDGDGTVLNISSINDISKNIFFNMKDYNTDNKKKINHANILESAPLLSLLQNKISDNKDTITLNKYFSENRLFDNRKKITFKVYSPADIHVYDKNGNHTGIVSYASNSNLENYENNINSSYYNDFDGVKLLQVPYDENYQVVLEGNNTGLVKLEIELSDNNMIIASSTFSDIPVTNNTNIDLELSTSTSDFASSTVMNIDSNGDRQTEYILNSDQFIKNNPKSRKEHRKYIKYIRRISRMAKIKDIIYKKEYHE